LWLSFFKILTYKMNDMKISYRNYPILEKLQKGKLGEMVMNSLDLDFFVSPEYNILNSTLMKNAKHFLEEINVISNSFEEACSKSDNKLLDLLFDILSSKEFDLSYSGTFILSGGYIYFLRYKFEKKTETYSALLYWFQKNMLIGYYNTDNDPNNAITWFCDDYKRMYNIETEVQTTEEAYSTIFRLILFKLFKTYAEVETKELKAHSVLREVDCKYVNDTQLPITYLDSKWFTNLVKSDAFNVRGHFRLHACGKGLQDHKLIWINEYTKSGYTAPTRMLSQTNH
jgi:hypothetical protein